jgi:galactokinase
VKSFRERFHSDPAVFASAHGRVNLLGEHTDYNEGLVLPAAIPQRTTIAMRASTTDRSLLYAANLEQECVLVPGQLPPLQFARYVHGCMEVVRARFGPIPPLLVHAASDVPMEVGLSSSAALEVATLRALRALLGLALDDIEIARLGQQAEIEYAGVHCGILDQMACSLLTPGQMLYLDTRSFERTLLPLPAGCELLVVDSGLSRSLASSKYNERRSECEQAAQALGLASLRECEDPRAVEVLPPPLRSRARHVVTENARVRQAQEASAHELGRLMQASHRSLSEDYEVSVPALDLLVRLLSADEDVYGAKLTGAGFGGACVALCREGAAVRAGQRVLNAYSAAGQSGKVLVPAGRV